MIPQKGSRSLKPLAAGHHAMDIAIIGAGAAGLAAARRLTPHHRVTVFESLPEIGGVWARSEAAVCQPIYSELRTNIPIDLMAFWDFPVRSQDIDVVTGAFPHASTVLHYLRRFAEHHGLTNLIQLNTRVLAIEPLASDRWKVRRQTSKPNSEVTSTEFDAVVISTGHYHRPVMPALPGIEQYGGRILHAADFLAGTDHSGERVLVWGAHASGTDLVRLIAPHAESVFWAGHADSMHSATNDLVNVQCCGDPQAFRSSAFVCEDQVSLAMIDTLIYCTGYAYDFPFLSEAVLNHDGERIDDLYRDLMHADYPTLTFVGIPSLIIPFPLFDAQSRWLSALWQDKIALPDRATRKAWIESRKRAFKEEGKPNRAFHRLGEAQMKYIRQLLAEAGEPAPPDWFESAARAAQKHRLEHAGDFRDQPWVGFNHRPLS